MQKILFKDDRVLCVLPVGSDNREVFMALAASHNLYVEKSLIWGNQLTVVLISGYAVEYRIERVPVFTTDALKTMELEKQELY